MSETTQSLTSLDLRVMQVSFQVNDELHTFDESFYIKCTGAKYANPLQNECNVEIANLNEDTRNYILTTTSPFNTDRTPKVLSFYAGRVSTGPFLVYQGDITTSKITQPPDITLTLKCGTSHFKKGMIGSRSGGANQSLLNIAKGVASNLNLSLNYQAGNKTVSNYTYSGNAQGEVANLQKAGVDAYIDDNQLVLKPIGVHLTGEVVLVSENTGMIGVPVVTEKGLKVTFLFTNAAKLGGGIQIESKTNPLANGLYVIYKLNWSMCSRDVEFYYVAECLKAKQV